MIISCRYCILSVSVSAYIFNHIQYIMFCCIFLKSLGQILNININCFFGNDKKISKNFFTGGLKSSCLRKGRIWWWIWSSLTLAALPDFTTPAVQMKVSSPRSTAGEEMSVQVTVHPVPATQPQPVPPPPGNIFLHRPAPLTPPPPGTGHHPATLSQLRHPPMPLEHVLMFVYALCLLFQLDKS